MAKVSEQKPMDQKEKLTLTYLSIDVLKPYERNARVHSKDQIQRIAKSIQKFGFNNPVIIDKDNGIVAGHGRVEAAKLLKMKQVPVICAEHLTEEQKKAYIIADNRLAELSGWDDDILRMELPEIEFDLADIGFEDFVIDPHAFEAGSEDDQGELDRTMHQTVKCPNCGEEIDLTKPKT